MAQQKTMATCPECGAKVRKENLEGHIDRVHKKAAAAKEKTPEQTARSTRPRIKDQRKVSPWPAIALAALMALSSLGAYAILTQTPGNPSNNPPSSGNRKAVVATSMGTFTIELREDKAPMTAGNFIHLVQQGFYNGKGFHRVVPGFVIQGGQDPMQSVPSISWENTGLKNVAYSVAMARTGSANNSQDKDTATSEFFVNLVNNGPLDRYIYPYVVFGQVTEGQSVVDAIGQIQVTPPSPPVVTISSITIVA